MKEIKNMENQIKYERKVLIASILFGCIFIVASTLAYFIQEFVGRTSLLCLCTWSVVSFTHYFRKYIEIGEN